MNKVVTTLFTGLIILTPAPTLSEELSPLSASELAPIVQANGFEVQEVRFRGGRGFRRGGFRRSRFRRGGRGFRRSRFRRDSFKHRRDDKFLKFKKFEKFDEHPEILKKKKFF